MNFPLYIAKRYLRSKSSNNAINYITIIAAIGIVLGSAALFIVLSGFSGLRDFSLQFTSLVDPDLKATAKTGKSYTLTPEELIKLKKLKSVANFSQVIEEGAIFVFDNKKKAAYIKGVDSTYTLVSVVDSIMFQGGWLHQDTYQTIAGVGIAYQLGMGVLDYGKSIGVYVPKTGTGQISSVSQAFNRVRGFNVGLFDINETLNDNYVFAPIGMTRELLGFAPNQLTALEFKLQPGVDEGEAREEILSVLGDKVVLKNRIQLNEALYKMLNTENLAVYLIFTLILIIALFNVIGSIIMMILDRKATLHTLYNLGATVNNIRRIFFIQGSLMTLLGGVFGLLLGVMIVWLQKTFSLVMITSTLPYPVSFKLENLFIVALTIGILGILTSKLASSRITKNLIIQ
ncbi:ABC transporter permease [Mangrovimonas aestuarii]|uniref:ABC transporter permease n=1 Tax=Mangrovimonas aestuarii TaxID=3018443 RepID=UPI0023789D0D|nr:FtsX-like permease family protein [Mangrovimonas aestuarii]